MKTDIVKINDDRTLIENFIHNGIVFVNNVLKDMIADSIISYDLSKFKIEEIHIDDNQIYINVTANGYENRIVYLNNNRNETQYFFIPEFQKILKRFLYSILKDLFNVKVIQNKTRKKYIKKIIKSIVKEYVNQLKKSN